MGRAEAQDELQDRAGDGAWGRRSSPRRREWLVLGCQKGGGPEDQERHPQGGFEVTGAQRSELAGGREPPRKSLLPDPRVCSGPLPRDMIFSLLCLESC